MKRTLALILILIFAFCAVPVQPIADILSSDEAFSENTFIAGNSYILHTDTVTLTSVASEYGLFGMPYDESSRDYLFTYTDEHYFVCDGLYLCAADGILALSENSENALNASCINDTLSFNDGECIIGYSTESNIFYITDNHDEAVTIYATDKTYIAVTGIELAEGSVTLEPNESYTVNAHVLPENATEQGLLYESSSPLIASVDEIGTVTALREGNAVIKITTKDGGFTAELAVTVSYTYFTVRFYDMDGVTVLSEQKVKAGSSAAAPALPVHYGYDFTGWLPADFDNITSDLDVYSTWSITVYDITLVLNGGTCDDFPTSYTVESGRIVLPVPTRLGYKFAGWYESPDFSGDAVTEIEIGSHGDKVFYADWDIIHYNIFYETNGGSLPEYYISTYTIDSPDIYPPEPVRTGYIFDGWYASPSFNDDEVWCIHSGSVGDIRLYAAWTPKKYNIGYELCGGSFENTVTTNYTIETESFALPIPTRLAYTFSGWYKSADYSGAQVSFIPKGSVGDLVLYAKWTPVKYSITVYPNGGTTEGNVPLTYTIESDTIILPKCSKRGYDFFGWYDNPGFSGSSITEISAGSYGDKAIYARFDIVQYSLVFNTNGGTISEYIPAGYNVESDTIILPVPSKTAYDFNGWFTSSLFVGNPVTEIPKGSVGDFVFYAKWTPTRYSITYITYGGEVFVGITSYTIESGDVLLPVVKKRGYDFMGWYDNASYAGSPVTNIPSGSYGDRVFYAKWIPTKYFITYEVNGGMMPYAYATEYNIETQDFFLPVPSKTGYTFGGWFTDPSFAGEPIDKIYIGSVGDILFYAKWDVITYSISYNTNGGTITGNVTYTYTIESLSVLLPTVEKRGYDFLGWYLTPNFSGERITFIKSGSYGDVEVYARFTPTIYTITYNTNGGQLTDAPMTYTIESDTFILPVPERTAYTFRGWFTTSFLVGTSITYIKAGSIGDIILYAKWIPTEYSIIYNLNGGTMPTYDFVQSYTIESGNVPLPRPVKTGHAFAGWYLNPDFSGVPITEIKEGTYGELDLYAKWNRLTFKVRFFDRDYATLLSEQYVEYGFAAVPPETVPEHEGCRFAGWSGDYTFISAETDFIAQYNLLEYTVTFTDIDLTVIEIQTVLYGHSAKAPEPPEHENCVFVFWSCDFSCVTSDMIVTAVYRAVAVSPKPLSEQRFIQFDEMQDDEEYIFCVKSNNTYYALTSLVRFDDKGLWAMPLTRSGNYMMTSDENADITDALFRAKGSQNDGFTLKSATTDGYLSSDKDSFTVENTQGASDVFSYVYKSGAWRLYDKTNNVYIQLSENMSYFTTGTIVKAAEIVLMKKISLPDYVMRQSPELNKLYTIVAVRPDGNAYALTEKEGKLIGTRVEISDKNIYFYDNINEKTVAFRMTFGDNSKGFSLRNADCMEYLGSDANMPILTNYVEKYWKYMPHPVNGHMTLYEVNDNVYLCCNAGGTFYVGNNDSDRTQIYLYERSLPSGRKGDANLDYFVNTGDAVFVLRCCAGMMPDLSTEQFINADINNDNIINTGDAVGILKYTVGLTDWLG